MKKIIALSSVFIALFLFSCNGTKKAATVSSNEIASGEYEIMNIQGEAFQGKLFITIDTSEKKIFGKTGCNSYFGNYTITGNELKFGPIGSTQMYCEENVMKVENKILEALRNTNSFVFDANMLTLSANDKIMLKLYRITKE